MSLRGRISSGFVLLLSRVFTRPSETIEPHRDLIATSIRSSDDEQIGLPLNVWVFDVHNAPHLLTWTCQSLLNNFTTSARKTPSL